MAMTDLKGAPQMGIQRWQQQPRGHCLSEGLSRSCSRGGNAISALRKHAEVQQHAQHARQLRRQEGSQAPGQGAQSRHSACALHALPVCCRAGAFALAILQPHPHLRQAMLHHLSEVSPICIWIAESAQPSCRLLVLLGEGSP